MNYFVTAIGTDSGKTLVSAILCKALQADYWKPIQAGTPTDSERVKQLNSSTKVHPEAYILQTPASPHAAAQAENLTIELDKINIPKTTNDLIIEGAGGCLVPINNEEFVIDIALRKKLKIILVSNIYLGSINHTLLTLNFLQQNKADVLGIIFNGPHTPHTEDIIMKHFPYPKLLHVLPEEIINEEVIARYAQQLKLRLDDITRKR